MIIRRALCEKIMFVFITLIFIFSGCSSIALRHNEMGYLRLDGIYQSEQESNYWYYARFYKDGTVLTACSIGNVNEVSRWLKIKNLAMANYSKGKFILYGDHIAFDSNSDLGTVYYEGTISSDLMLLNTSSNINNIKNTRIFRFTKTD